MKAWPATRTYRDARARAWLVASLVALMLVQPFASTPVDAQNAGSFEVRLTHASPGANRTIELGWYKVVATYVPGEPQAYVSSTVSLADKDRPQGAEVHVQAAVRWNAYEPVRAWEFWLRVPHGAHLDADGPVTVEFKSRITDPGASWLLMFQKVDLARAAANYRGDHTNPSFADSLLLAANVHQQTAVGPLRALPGFYAVALPPGAPEMKILDAAGHEVELWSPPGAGPDGPREFRPAHPGPYFFEFATLPPHTPYQVTFNRGWHDYWPDRPVLNAGATTHVVEGVGYGNAVAVADPLREGLVVVEVAATHGIGRAPVLTTEPGDPNGALVSFDPVLAVVRSTPFEQVRVSMDRMVAPGKVPAGSGPLYIDFPNAQDAVGAWEVRLRQPAPSNRLASAPIPIDEGRAFLIDRGPSTATSNLVCLPAGQWDFEVRDPGRGIVSPRPYASAGLRTVELWNAAGDIVHSWDTHTTRRSTARIVEGGNHMFMVHSSSPWELVVHRPDRSWSAPPGTDVFAACDQDARPLTGTVAVSHWGVPIPLPDVRVQATVVGTARTYETNADETGAFRIPGHFLRGDEVRLRVDLTDAPPAGGSRSPDGPPSGGTVRLLDDADQNLTHEAATFTLSGAGETFHANVLIEPRRGPSLDPAEDARPYSADPADAALLYTEAMDAVAFARETLLLRPGYKLPIQVYVPAKRDVGSSYYLTEDSTIHMHPSAASWHNAHRAIHHEVGHHIRAEAVWSEDGQMHTWAAGDRNHAGVLNTDSYDSLEEGYATFYAARVQGSPVYQGQDLERLGPGARWVAETEDGTGVLVRVEESYVSALLWDLVDPANEPEDTVDLGVLAFRDPDMADRTLFNALRSANPRTMHDLFVALNTTYGHRTQVVASGPFAGLNGIETLFVHHGFYWDQNGNDRWDHGEAPGYASSLNAAEWAATRADPPRKDMPMDDATMVTTQLVGPDGEPTDGAIEVAVLAPAGGVTHRFVIHSDDGGTARWPMLVTGASFHITPLAPGYVGEPLVVSGSDWERHVVDALREGLPHALQHTFALRDSAVPAPTDVRVAWREDGRLDVSWEPGHPGQDVILVRSAGAPPRNPTEGMVLHRGTNTSFVDGPLATTVPWSYAVFGHEEGVGLSVPATRTVVVPELTLAPRDTASLAPDGAPSPEPVGDAPRGGGADTPAVPVWALLAAVFVLARAEARRRERRGHE